MMALAALLAVSGCDAGVHVRGRLEPSNAIAAGECQVSLMYMGRILWMDAGPTASEQSKTGAMIDVRWVIGGPIKERWVEVDCPGFETFRSEKFVRETVHHTVDLGVVKLIPTEPSDAKEDPATH
jgi:hypothetical protein